MPPGSIENLHRTVPVNNPRNTCSKYAALRVGFTFIVIMAFHVLFVAVASCAMGLSFITAVQFLISFMINTNNLLATILTILLILAQSAFIFYKRQEHAYISEQSAYSRTFDENKPGVCIRPFEDNFECISVPIDISHQPQCQGTTAIQTFWQHKSPCNIDQAHQVISIVPSETRTTKNTDQNIKSRQHTESNLKSQDSCLLLALNVTMSAMFELIAFIEALQYIGVFLIYTSVALILILCLLSILHLYRDPLEINT